VPVTEAEIEVLEAWLGTMPGRGKSRAAGFPFMLGSGGLGADR
jgi:hypothetical protein